MAKEIDLTKPLSEFDLQYLVDRNRWDDIRVNAENLGKDVPSMPSARGLRAQVPRRQLRDTDAFDQIAKQLGVRRETTEEADNATTEEQKTDWSKLTVAQLKEEMDKRRSQYEAENDSEGVALMTYAGDARKDDLVTALQMDEDAEDDSAES